MGLLADLGAYRVVVEVTLLSFDDCPNWRRAADLIERLAREHQDVTVSYRIVNTDSDAQQLGFVGSPTILIDGVDPWATSDAPVGLSCRIFATPDGPKGSPTWEQLTAAVQRPGPDVGAT
jgi:hypothetical protein